MSPHPGSDGEAKEHKRITVGGGISEIEEGKGSSFVADPQIDAGQHRRKKPGLSISLDSDSTDSWEGFLSILSMLVAQHRQLAYILAGVLIAVGVSIGLVNVGGGTPGSAALGQQQGRLNTRGATTAITIADLGRLIARQADKAVAVGALQTIATSFEIIPDHHLDFIVSRAEEGRAERKDAATVAGASVDPFAEGQRDQRLVVTDVGPDHVLMLNKFNTMNQHVLVVTKGFASQEGLLAASDLAALSAVVRGTPAVGFYNSGLEAGASQRHRHLQAVPLHVLQQYNPQAKQAVPMDSLMDAFLATHGSPPSASFSLPSLPFRHRFLLLPDDDPATLEGAYHRLLRRVGCSMSPSTADSAASPTSLAPCDVAYNLVLTPRWMLLVPRTQHMYLGVGVNALGFIGALLARGDEAMLAIKTAGPMTVLRGVTFQREL